MKCNSNSKRILSFLLISFLVILGAFNLPFVYAIHNEGDGVTFYPDDDHPIQYGVFIPESNMFNTMSIDASNQGRFAMINWDGGEDDYELVDFPGEDISGLYPWYFDDYYKDTSSNNNFTDPWLIDWINVTTLNPHNITLSNYTINSVFNYYVLIEGSDLIVPLNHSIPIQIDVIIESIGPKILRTNWLTDDPSNIINQNIKLISPSGKIVDLYKETATSHAMQPPIALFDYLSFVTHETGAYRLLVYAEHNAGKPAYLNLDFLSTSIHSLPLETLKFAENTKDILAIDENEYSSWQSNWFRINGDKGDIMRLQLNKDISTKIMGVTIEPIISIWSPCENGYIRDSYISEGIYDIYFPTSGNAYISFVDADYGNWYRYSLFAKKYESIEYNIGANKTTIKISKEESKIIEFSVQGDSFVQFNFTSISHGNPYLNTLGTNNAIIFINSKEQDGYKKVTPLKTKMVNDEWFYYYYMPNGTYKAIIKNSDVTSDGIFEISSKYIDCADTSIPINSLTYPSINASTFLTLEFEQDELYNGLFEAKYVNINITEPGQYILSTTINATEYLPINLTPIPSKLDMHVVVYNDSHNTYHDWTEEALDPLKSFPAFSDDGNDESWDILYIAYHQKWNTTQFNFSIPGTAGNFFVVLFWDGFSWNYDWPLLEGTSAFTTDGSIVLDTTSFDYQNWIPGADFDLPNINESHYYWLGIWNIGGDYVQLPYLQTITLSGMISEEAPEEAVELDMDLALVGESKYEYGDFWKPEIASKLEFLFSNETGNLYVTEETNLFENTNPYTIGLERGLYKLLIIPELWWNYSGPIEVNFAIKNYLPYNHQETYNIKAISPTPNLYMYQIQNYTEVGYGQINGNMYDYGLITQYNDTEASITVFPGNLSYFMLECYGNAYQWTQLVVSTNNVSHYNLYLMQDLPWVSNLPNMEVALLASASMPFVNNTHEFGVHTDHFYLLFEVDELDDLITFRTTLSQYNTTILTASSPVASYTPPTDYGPWILVLAISLPVAAGVIVVVYILKRKGRILTKHPI